MTEAQALAEILLGKFGDLGRVLTAPRADLLDTAGMREEQVQMVDSARVALTALLRAKASEQPVLTSYAAVIDYLHATLAHSPKEAFRVIYLDRRNRIIADEEQGRGTVNHVPVYTREVIASALRHNASALVLAHNHPSGDPTPSDSDRKMTTAIMDAGAALGITVHDHIIIGHGKEFSFRANGII